MSASHTGSRALLVYAMLYTAFLYAPIALLVLFSFNDSSIVSFPLKGFTSRWYEALLANGELIGSFANSLKVGTVSAMLSTIFGTLGAKALAHRELPGGGAMTGLIMLPLVIPSVVVGIAILMMARFALGLTPSLALVCASHVLLCTPFAMLIMRSSFEGLDPDLEEASLDLGQNRVQTFLRITLPFAWPAIVASLLMCFTISFDEFVLAFFLSGNEATLPIFIFSQLRFPARLPEVLALGSLVVLASAGLVLAAQLVRRRDGAEPIGL